MHIRSIKNQIPPYVKHFQLPCQSTELPFQRALTLLRQCCPSCKANKMEQTKSLPASYFQCSWLLLVITVVQFSDTSGNFHLIVFNYNDYAVSPIIKCFPYVRHNKIVISPSATICTLIQLLGGVKCVCLGSKGTATNMSFNIPRKHHRFQWGCC